MEKHKKLYLARHAEAEPIGSNGDASRALTVGGELQAAGLGKELRKRGARPQAIAASPAVRARRTAELVAEGIGYAPESILLVPEIYEATTRRLLEVINATDEAIESLLLVGHNPAFSMMTAYLTQHNIAHLPPAGAIHIAFDLGFWSFITMGAGRFEWYLDPDANA